MTRKEFVSSKLVRLIAAIWIFIVPIFVFIIPAVEFMRGESPDYMTALYGAVMWLLGPFAAMIVLNMVFGPKDKPAKQSDEELK